MVARLWLLYHPRSIVETGNNAIHYGFRVAESKEERELGAPDAPHKKTPAQGRSKAEKLRQGYQADIMDRAPA